LVPISQLCAIAWIALPLLAACVNELPPAATPAAIAPDVPVAAPPGEGQGRLVVDVVEGSTPITRIRMEPQQVGDDKGRVSYEFFESPELVCTASPCVVDLSLGNVLLGFPVLGDPDAMEIELVHVGAEASVYRRSLSVYDGSTGAGLVLGILGTVFGASAAITGIVLLPVGLGNENDGLAIAGAITLGAGAALLALGIWAITLDSPTYRPGTSVHFPLGSGNAR
jgi:hypothetical protein